MRFAFGLKGAGDRRVGIFSQENKQSGVFFQRFSDLFCADEHPMLAWICEIAAFRDSTMVFSVHTGTYYTHFFGNVNKNYQKFSTFWPSFLIPGTPLPFLPIAAQAVYIYIMYRAKKPPLKISGGLL